jgi:two-component system response regulator NreC
VIRILIVDDHAILREGVRSLLATVPEMEVVGEAENGEDAVTEARRLKPDVVLMDIVMPLSDGLEATEKIHRELPDTKVLVLSMYDDEEVIRRAIRVGASGYVLKGSGSDDLVRAILQVSQGGVPLHPTVAAKIVGDYVRQIDSGNGPTDEAKNAALSPRELEVLRLIAEGHTNLEIAAQLGLSRKTVDNHRANIMRKIDAHDVTQLLKFALRQGIIRLEPRS